jgi:preprotein translocase subunit SecD
MNKMVLAILLVCAVALGALVMESSLAIYSGPHMALLSRPPAHGTAFVIAPAWAEAGGDTNAVARLKDAINRRFYKFGVRLFWEPLPQWRARVVTPITAERELAFITNLLSQSGHLEFRLVHPDSDRLAAGGTLPADYELLRQTETLPSGQTRVQMVAAKRKPEAGLGGSVLKSAAIMRDSLGQPSIDFELNKESTAAFAQLTRTNVGQRLAIVVDGKLYSAPVIRAPIESGLGQITGKFSATEANLLANLIEYPLPVPVTVVEAKTF